MINNFVKNTVYHFQYVPVSLVYVVRRSLHTP